MLPKEYLPMFQGFIFLFFVMNIKNKIETMTPKRQKVFIIAPNIPYLTLTLIVQKKIEPIDSAVPLVRGYQIKNSRNISSAFLEAYYRFDIAGNPISPKCGVLYIF